ncbi:MAG: hypothetical protein AMJ54_06445 [Deltaproteobacteria bacterium SG8_13]|nr:MAG: hypothetical protein AMJ54_06445 [Deltaproteobacteria bacterium SG8_13]
MNPRLHYLQHVDFEGPGTIRTWAEAAGCRFTGSRLHRNDPLPSMESFDWLVVMGGPMNVYEETQYPWLAREKAFIGRAIEHKKVLLGICLGAQLIADALGARISENRHKEIGWYPVYRIPAPGQLPQVSALADTFEGLHWHADTFELPEGAVHLARSEACDNQAFLFGDRVLGLQFHLEMTAEGLQRLVQFCSRDITGNPYVQSPEKMLANPLRFQRANRILKGLLDGLAAADAVGSANSINAIQPD